MKSLYLAENAASFVSDCFPDPPYPTSKAWPSGNLMIL